MNFDLHDRKCWDSFFNFDAIRNNTPHQPLATCTSIQEPILQYREPNDHLAAELEVEIMEQVKTSIRSWRRIPSSFNNDISNRLRIIISDLEERKFNGMKAPPAADYFASLESLCRGKQIFGFPLHCGFSSVQEILDMVASTTIHESKHPDVEFGVAVKIFPYACNTFSVWVFVCSLVPDYM